MITLKAQLTYRDPDGSNETTTAWTDRYTDDVLLNREIGTFPVGYDQLALSALLPVGKIAWKYSVRLYDEENAAISEIYTFHLDPEDANQLFFLFCNSLGAPETLRTIGGWEQGTEYSLEELLRDAGMDDDLDQHQQYGLPVGQQRTLKVSTGFMPRGELLALLDVLVSPEIRLIDEARGQYVPVRLQNGKARVMSHGDDAEHLYALNLELLIDDTEEVVSELPSSFFDES